METEKNGEFDWKVRVFDTLSFPTLILKPDGAILSVNVSFIKRYGIPKEQVMGRYCHDFFYQSSYSCPLDVCPLAAVLQSGEGQTILSHVASGDGEEKWEDRVFSPILDDEGHVRYIIESIRDVTRVKTMEKELSELRGFLEKAIQVSTSAIVAADMKGNILVMNRAAEEITGYTLREAKEKITARELHTPGQAEEIMKKLRDSEIGGKGRLPCTQVNFLNSRGESIPVELSAAIIYEGEEELATMGIFNDMRDKLAQEERMRQMMARVAQAEKMASLGQLAAGVAHEINNPLTGILLYASLAFEGMEDDDPRKDDLKYVIEDANRCKGIVRNLLAYSRQTLPDKETVEMNDLVEQSLRLIRDQRLFMRVEVVKELSERNMLIHADKNQLSQVFINLIINAIDAMNREGTLTLRTYPSEDGHDACFEVSDTGCGISEENVMKIFDPFFTTKEIGKGTGLGLSTAYGIVRDNEGIIRVKETGKKGTTFLVTLPIYDSSETEII
ncbi:MAG: PAS domain S-box protein [Syntrophobacteraceae bacterium]|nr:PAS domain S-box protein [Syntrophobacteraceae bacterium]